MTKQYEGILEIDTNRGVIYFHLTNPKAIELLGAMTILRICSLPTPIIANSIDITHMVGVSYNKKIEG